MEQIRFIDKFLRIFSFNGIDDYNTKISINQYKDGSEKKEELLKKINNEMVNIRKLFKTSQMIGIGGLRGLERVCESGHLEIVDLMIEKRADNCNNYGCKGHPNLQE